MKTLLFSLFSIFTLTMALAFCWHVYLVVLSFSTVENSWEATGQVWALLCYGVFAITFIIGTVYGVQRALGFRSD